jgi:hypothetical protein
MKSFRACILDIRKPNGQFYTRLRIPLRQWELLEREAKAAGVTVMGLIVPHIPVAIRGLGEEASGKAVAA